MTYLAVVFGIILSINAWGVYDFFANKMRTAGSLVALASVAELFGVLGYFHAMHMLGVVVLSMCTLLALAIWTHRQAARHEQGLPLHWSTRWILI
jgi:hypothetical protein